MAENHTVQKLVERTRMSDTGSLEKYFRVEALTAKGTFFTLDIPETQMEPAEAKKILTARAKQLDSMLPG